MMKSGFNRLPDYQEEHTKNLLYITVNPATAKGIRRTKVELDKNRVNDIAIYNLNDNTLKYLFADDKNRTIVNLIFEKKYDETTKMINFNTHLSNTINNEKVGKRVPSDHLFIIVEGETKGKFEFWQSNKLGTSLRLIKIFTDEIVWKLDVLNQKILFIEKQPYRVQIEAFDW